VGNVGVFFPEHSVEGHSESANFRQLCVIFSVAFIRQQHHSQSSFFLTGNSKESTFNPVLDLDANPDHYQNLIASNFGRI